MSRIQQFVFWLLAVVIVFWLAVILLAGLYALAWHFA